MRKSTDRDGKQAPGTAVSHRDVLGDNESEHAGNGSHGICAVWVLCQFLQTKPSFFLDMWLPFPVSVRKKLAKKFPGNLGPRQGDGVEKRRVKGYKVLTPKPCDQCKGSQEKKQIFIINKPSKLH